MRASVLIVALLAPLPALAQAPDRMVPANPDVSGLWALDPFSIPEWTERPRHCIDQLYRASNFPKYGASYLQLWKTSERAEVIGGAFDPHPSIIFGYEGRIHYTQGYARTGSDPRDIDYRCGSEAAEYSVTGELTWNIDTGHIEMGFGGPLISTPQYRHSLRASAGGYFADLEGKVLYGNINGSASPGQFMSGAFANYNSYPGMCTGYLHDHYRDWELTSCSPRLGYSHYLRRVEAPAALTGKISGVLIEALNGVRTSTRIPNALVTAYEQSGRIRAQMNGETEAEYVRFIASQVTRASVAGSTRSGPDGRFAIELPIFKAHAARKRLDRRAYVLVVTEARRNETIAGQPRTKYYLSTARRGLTPPNETEVLLQPVTGIAEKIAVTDKLIALCPNRYGPIEQSVKAYVERLATGTPRPEQVEGVQRALMAEQIAVPAVDYARTFLDMSFDPLATLVSELAKKIMGSGFKGNRELGEATEKLTSKSTQAFDDALLRHPNALRGAASESARVATLEALAHSDAGMVFLIRNVKGAITAMGAALKDALLLLGLENPLSEEIAGGVIELSLTLLEAVMTRDPTELTGFVIAEIIKAAKDPLVNLLIDQGELSYCGVTERSLLFSAREIDQWDVADPVALSTDLDRVYHRVAAPMHEVVAVQLRTAAYMRAIADTAGSSKDVFEFIPTPQTQLAAKVAFATQIMAEITNITALLGMAFYGLPAMVEAGARLSFGQMTNPGVMSPNPWVGTSTAIRTELLATLGQIHSAASYTEGHVRGAAFGQIIADIANKDPAQSIPAAMGGLLRANARVQAALVGVRDDDRELRRFALTAGARVVELQMEAQSITVESFRIVEAIVSGEYMTEQDPGLNRARLALMARTRSLKNKALALSTAFEPILGGWRFLAVRPAIRVGDLQIESTTVPGNGLRTRSPETFTVRARVENVSAVAIEATTARLSIRAPMARIVGSADVAVPALAADDGNKDSGSDEQVVSWTVEVTAPIDGPGVVLLVLDVIDSATPARFVTDSSIGVIEVDEALTDTDGDRMPDAWERRVGLNPAQDDSAADADGDGLPNIDELQRGTKPDMTDSDMDGLSDRDELRGAGGRLPTDPSSPDTDGDGANDAMDGDPRDATSITSTTSSRGGEPEVSLDACFVSLNIGRDFTRSVGFVGVRNAGTSSLSWTVEGDTKGAVKVLPASPTIIDGPGKLTLIAESVATEPIELWVTDLSGAVRDRKRLLVYVGLEVPSNPCDGPSPGSDGGVVVPGSDGAVIGSDGGRPVPGVDASVGPGPDPGSDRARAAGAPQPHRARVSLGSSSWRS